MTMKALVAPWMRCVVVSGFLGLGLTQAGADSILWEQEAQDGNGAFMTNSESMGLDFADAFDVNIGWHVERVTWWGSLGENEEVPETFDFDITFFTDDGSGAPLGSDPVAEISGTSDVMQTDLQTDLTNGSIEGEDVQVLEDAYEFSMEFSSPVTLGAGRHYISIDSPEDRVFSWMFSGDGDGTSWYTDDPGNGWDTQNYNFASRLEGQVIPEPTTMTLLGIGVAGLGLRRWRGCKRTYE